MKSTSTGMAESSGPDKESETGKEPRGGSGQTTTSVNGEKSPRLPHERDESGQTYPGAPSKTMETAKADAESGKKQTDRSVEANEAYDELRAATPGKERDGGGSK